jgi:molybdate transport system regulatory protein
MKLNYKIWIESDEGVSILGEGKWKLLQAIKQTGSLKAAAEKVGYAYRQTWESLKNVEDKIGFKLVEKIRGGESGGKTVLTPKGEQLLDFFEELYIEVEPLLQRSFDKLNLTLNRLKN